SQTLYESVDARLSFLIICGSTHEHADTPPPLGLLRTRHERPRCRRAAEHRDELAAFHSITSSARASSVGGTCRPSAFATQAWPLRASRRDHDPGRLSARPASLGGLRPAMAAD